jgi:two-component system NarL family sensor kinase
VTGHAGVSRWRATVYHLAATAVAAACAMAGAAAGAGRIPLVLPAILAVSVAAYPLTLRAARRSAADHLAAAAHALAVADRQRYELARQLHDGPIQNLAAANVALSALPADAGHPAVREMVRESIAQLRALTAGLMPVAPGDLAETLPVSLRSQVNDAIELDIAVEPEVASVGEAHRTLLAQAAIELVRNACRHGHPTRIRVEVTAGKAGVALSVGDNGAGFDPGETPPGDHLGLALLGYAAASAGGAMTVDSSPGAGCTVTMTLPAARG